MAVRGHPRSSILIPIESAYATSYLSLRVTLEVPFSRYIDEFSTKIACFPSHPCLIPQRRNALRYQRNPLNVLYSVVQRYKLHGSVAANLILAPKHAKSREIPREFERSSKVIDLGVNRKRICDFLLVINSNFARISYRFSDIDF